MVINQLQRHLMRMNVAYQAICRAFAEGEIAADEARQQVHQLSYTDHNGHTWRVDTTRSGHMAAFTNGIVAITLGENSPPPVARHEWVDADPDSGADSRRGLLPMLVGLGLTAVLAGVPIAYLLLDEERTTTAGPTVPVPTIPEFTVVPTTAVEPTPTGTVLPTEVPTTLAEVPAITTEGKTIDEIPFETDVQFGESVQGRPLVLQRRGEAGGVRVLVVGVIHGNEQAGLQVVDLLQEMEIDEGVDLWLVPMVNPDGVANNVRHNANKVDLNRNFPRNWAPLGEPGYWEYSGEAAASEPEVKATMALAELIQPHFVIWYHQDYFRISPSTGRSGEIRERYAELVDLPLVQIVGGTYTGTAGSWVSTVLAPNGVSILIEFGAELRPGEAQANANAILTIVEEFFRDDS